MIKALFRLIKAFIKKGFFFSKQNKKSSVTVLFVRFLILVESCVEGQNSLLEQTLLSFRNAKKQVKTSFFKKWRNHLLCCIHIPFNYTIITHVSVVYTCIENHTCVTQNGRSLCVNVVYDVSMSD